MRERLVAGEPLAAHTTYKIGGPAEAAAFPANTDELRSALAIAKRRGVPLTVLGLGSNVLVGDGGVAGLVIFTTGMADIAVAGETVSAQCGAPLDRVVDAAVGQGLAGVEMLSGIPGTVGGGVYMNAGAFNQETFDRLTELSALTPEGKEITLKKSEVKPRYRKVEGIEGLLVLSASWTLSRGDGGKLSSARRDTLKRRADKQPLEFPSAGSVFKRPPGGFASKLIDEAGLKGLSVGGARVSEKHAGFIVNTGGATASDVRSLIAKVQAAVKNSSGIALELEQITLGKF